MFLNVTDGRHLTHFQTVGHNCDLTFPYMRCVQTKWKENRKQKQPIQWQQVVIYNLLAIVLLLLLNYCILLLLTKYYCYDRNEVKTHPIVGTVPVNRSW